MRRQIQAESWQLDAGNGCRGGEKEAEHAQTKARPRLKGTEDAFPIKSNSHAPSSQGANQQTESHHWGL